MRKIEAFIKPHKLVEVTRAVHGVPGVTGLSVAEFRGFGRGGADQKNGSTQYGGFDYVAHLKIEVFCPDDVAPDVVNAIESAAHTGLRGDGKIYVARIEDAVRISTGERGDDAV